jgi:hypothetical protein
MPEFSNISLGKLFLTDSAKNTFKVVSPSMILCGKPQQYYLQSNVSFSALEFVFVNDVRIAVLSLSDRSFRFSANKACGSTKATLYVKHLFSSNPVQFLKCQSSA